MYLHHPVPFCWLSSNQRGTLPQQAAMLPLPTESAWLPHDKLQAVTICTAAAKVTLTTAHSLHGVAVPSHCSEDAKSTCHCI